MNSKLATISEPEKPDFLRILKLTSVALAGGILCYICEKAYQDKKEYDAHYKQHSNNIIYTCIVCRKQNNNYPSFRGHCYTNHVIKDRFQCKHCSKKLSTKFALQEHTKAMHIFICSIKGCKKQFTTQNELTLHKIIHKNEENKPPYQCQACDKQMTSIDESEHHVDKHCTFTYSCPICNEEFKKNEARKHLKAHFEDSISENNDDIHNDDEDNEMSDLSSLNIIGGILCCHCKKTFKNRELFDSHFILEHADKNLVYSCIVCKKQFKKYPLLGGHCYDHVAKTKFECEECDKSFTRLSHLVMHTDMYHSAGAALSHPDGAPLQCAHCPCTFFGDGRYRHHLRTKHDTETIDCPEPGCTSTFHTQKELILHAKVHNCLSNWCRQCGLQLPTLASCEKHLDVHRKKLYSCPVCNRNYRDKNPVMNHLSQHFEAILHICKVCGKVYNAKRRLVEHVKIHSIDKKYKCQYCTKSFAKTNHLKQHLATHTGIKPYKCTVCSKTFASYPNWHKHLRKTHNLDKNSIKNTVTNNNSNTKETPSPEPIHNEIYKTQSTLTEKQFDYESDSSTMNCDSVEPIENKDPAVFENESQIFEAELDIGATTDSIDENNILPEEIADFATEAAVGPSLLPLARAAALVPREYGPDFVNTALEIPDCTVGKFIDLDDHLPHIDPRLATTTTTTIARDVTDFKDVSNDVAAFIRNQPIQYNYEQSLATMGDTDWKPPVITKVYGNFYNEIGDMTSNLVSVINSNVF